MKIKFTTLMVQLDGKPVKEPSGDGETKTLTLGDICTRALMSDTEEMDGKKKVDMFNLAMRITGTNKDVEISVEECVLLKNRIAKSMGPLISGQCWNLLDKADSK